MFSVCGIFFNITYLMLNVCGIICNNGHVQQLVCQVPGSLLVGSNTPTGMQRSHCPAHGPLSQSGPTPLIQTLSKTQISLYLLIDVSFYLFNLFICLFVYFTTSSTSLWKGLGPLLAIVSVETVRVRLSECNCNQRWERGMQFMDLET